MEEQTKLIARAFIVILAIITIVRNQSAQASGIKEVFQTQDVPSVTSEVPVLYSYFSGTDTEGWTQYLGSLQNPGEGGSGGGIGNGYLKTSLPSDNRTSYFVAPAQYHGDWSEFNELRVEMWSKGGIYYTSGYSMRGDIYLANNGKTAQLLLPRRPALTWDQFVVKLDETEAWVLGGGATNLQEILNNVTDFQLRAEYGVGSDETGLDSVEIFGTITTGLFSVSGQVIGANGNPIPNVTIEIPSGRTATTDAQGNYWLPGLAEGVYELIASKSGYQFWPPKLNVQVGPDAVEQNFTEWKCAQEVPLYLQGRPSTPNTLPDPAWSNKVYGNYPDGDTYNTIGRWGCKVSSDAMMISYFSSRYQPQFDTDPAMLNSWLRSQGGYDINNGVRRSHIFAYAWQNGMPLYLWDSISGVDNPSLDRNLCSGQPALLKVKNPYGDHFVVATGKITVNGQTTYTISDPAHGQTTLLEHYNNSYLRADYYALGPTVIDNSMLEISAHSPVHLLITDPLGRKLGYDPRSDVIWDEIPHAGYDTEAIGESEGSLLPEAKVLFIAQPLPGQYTVQVIGYEDGAYTIRKYQTDISGGATEASFRGEAQKNSVDEYAVKVGEVIYLPMITK